MWAACRATRRARDKVVQRADADGARPLDGHVVGAVAPCVHVRRLHLRASRMQGLGEGASVLRMNARKNADEEC